MNTSRNFLIRCTIGVLAAISTILAAIGVMLLGWIITAHASVGSSHDDGDDETGPIICQHGIEGPMCSPTFPGFITQPATLVDAPDARRRPGLRPPRSH